MEYLPLFAKLTDEPCLVIGGGEIAARKIRQLQRAGARITVVAPELNAELRAAVDSGLYAYIEQEFSEALIGDHLLLTAATGDRAVNQRVASAASAARRLCNVVDDRELSTFIMPSVIDRSPIVVAVSSGGHSPILARMLRQRIEDWLPERIGELASWAGKWRSTAHQKILGHASRLRFWESTLDGAAADAVLDGNVDRANRLMTQTINGAPSATEPGEAWLIGAGPGDPGLITRRGIELLRRADAVLYDRLVSAEVIELARRDASMIPVGKQPGGPSTTQSDINEQLVTLVQQGKRVCRLKGGDPFIFGRGGEEIAALNAAGLPYQVIPGITAAAGCAASLAIPLTQRKVSSAVTFVTGHGADQPDDPGPDWPMLAASQHTLVIYMGVARISEACARLIRHGRPATTPAAIVENGTTEQQRVIGGTLATLPDRASDNNVQAPALVIIGDVVALAGTMQWTDNTNDPNVSAHTIG
ncbi:MAG: siroheme synthase CysG [Gammaproteobacteria bacterium]|nr:siroheme synthase CysG [Gammaproteobacteria bacterium]